MFRASLLAVAVSSPAVLFAQVPTPQAELIFFTVDGQEGSQELVPGFGLHSSWSGLGVASTGDVYIAVSNHNQPGGNVALFKYDPRAEQISLLDDLKSVSTAVDNWMPAESQYKVHTFLMEHADGEVYFGTMDHDPTPFLRGGHLYTIDPATDTIADFSKTQPFLMTKDFQVIPNTGEAKERSGVFIEHFGIKGIGLNPAAPDDLYAMTYPEGHLIHYDLKTGAMEKVGESGTVSYVFYVDQDGNAFYTREHTDGLELLKYDRGTGMTTSVETFPGFQVGAIAPTAAGDVVYVLVADTKQVYRLLPAENKFEHFASLCGTNWWRVYNLTLSPDEETLYYVSNNNSRRTIRKIDVATQQCSEVLDIDSLLGSRQLCFGGIGTWDNRGNFYAPVWTWDANSQPRDVVLLKVKVEAPGVYETFGAGCPGTAGVPSLDAAPSSAPRIGEMFDVALADLPPGNGSAFVAFGFSKTDWAGIPLPADLGAFGLTGCTGYVSVDAAFPVATSAGAAQFGFPIPMDTSLVGLPFYNQGVVMDPGVNLFGATVTNAAEGIVGIQ